MKMIWIVNLRLLLENFQKGYFEKSYDVSNQFTQQLIDN